MGKTIGVLLLGLMHLFLAGMVNSGGEVPCQVTMVLKGDDLGSQSNPVKCDGIKGEEEYLTRLRDMSGRPVIYRRIGHGYVKSKRKILILDKFEIKARDGSICAEIYLYSDCPNCVENEAINGFEMGISAFTTHITYKYESQPLTANDVYRMIIDNGFYCEAFTGSPFHDEGLTGLQKPQGSSFPLKRIVFSGERSSGLIETLSEIDHGPSKKGDNSIRLCWYPKIKECNFEKAIEIIEKLNRTKAGGLKRWRIPTLKELFSIVTTERNHFPASFDFHDRERLIFWTATPVKKDGTVLAYDKSNKAYFVIRSVACNTGDKYALSFSSQNTFKGKNKAFLLPVFSEKEPKYQTHFQKKPEPFYKKVDKEADHKSKIAGFVPGKTKPKATVTKDKIPGFDDLADMTGVKPKKVDSTKTKPKPKSTKSKIPPKPSLASTSDKIPGFDDLPDSKRKSGSPKKAGMAIRTVKIALFPYMLKGQLTGDEEKFLNDLNEEIAISLKDLNSKLRKDLNLSLVIEKKDSFDRRNSSEIATIYNIVSTSKGKRNLDLRKIMKKIMEPQNIDILLTVKHNKVEKATIEFFAPIIISKFNNNIYQKVFIQDCSYSNKSRGDIMEHMKKKIKEIIESHLKKMQGF